MKALIVVTAIFLTAIGGSALLIWPFASIGLPQAAISGIFIGMFLSIYMLLRNIKPVRQCIPGHDLHGYTGALTSIAAYISIFAIIAGLFELLM